MIEGGGLGVYTPDEVGPISVQAPNGVVDVTVADDVEAVRVAKQYLSYFQGPTSEWECADQRLLRSAIPENRLRVYDVHAVVDTLCDTGSVLELRPQFGVGIVTALVRIEGRPLGIIANNPVHLGGAIDSDGADKAARFMQLCDALRPADPVPVRHAGVHGRAGGREDRPGAALQPHVRRRRQHDRAVLHDHPAQGLRAGRAVDGGRQLPGTGVHGGVADR